ncbi:unnamed protein product [Rotaria sordida]|uniref:Uncharacterized protein n=1 Tax=Rotaria sordida TaxID=392033 RepID=A0A819EFV9_9BILA|nr:unnamed protein product [Rotaria sordida]
MCNQNQISKSLPLKKRRAYMIDTSTANSEQNEYCPTKKKQILSQDDSLQMYIPSSSIVPTPPSSPHLELLRQQYAFLLANSTNIIKQNSYYPLTFDSFMTQQYLDHFRVLIEQQKQQHSYTIVEDQQKQTDLTIDEHFRKSLGNSYNKFTGRCLTPDDSSSNSSSIERTSVDSIEEHFARSLTKFWSLHHNKSSNEDQTSSINHHITESIVDDHFAKALGSTTWEKLKEKL